jgi:molecular chaperone DnaK (HSP70)
MDIAKIKNSKEYRLTKIEVLNLYFETKEMNELLLKQLAEANANKKPSDIADILYEDQYSNEDKLNIIIEPCDNEPEPEDLEKKLEVLTYVYNNKNEDLKVAREELKEAKQEIKNLQKVISDNGSTKELEDKYSELVKEHNHALTKLHNIESVFSNLRKLLMPGV